MRRIHFRGRWLVLDKFGAIGAILTAATAPCCFPLVAAVGAALGLGALQSVRSYVDYAMQAMVTLALVGNILAWRQHRQRGPMLAGSIAAATVFFAYHGYYHVALIYAGLIGLTLAAMWNAVAKRRTLRSCCGENV